jgi:starch phosphorylase
VDVWLNTPRRLQEACGTSGMKAALNGVLHLSIRDGWWYEGYDGANGWVVGAESKPADPTEEDRLDGEALYDILEKTVVPLYYDRDHQGVPRGWTEMMKKAISSIVPRFSARRMLKDYARGLYFAQPS